MVIILTQDLMMSSSVSAVARAKQLPFKSAVSVEKVVSILQEHPVSKLLIDLQLPKLNLEQLIDQIKDLNLQTSPQTMAYAQHVYPELLETARKLGVDHVLTRGQIARSLEIILEYLP